MSDLVLPDLDELPTEPPPPAPVEPDRGSPAPRLRPRTGGGRLWRVLALILATQAALVSSALLVAVERPSLAWSLAAVALTDAFMVWAFATVLGMVVRTR